MVIPCLEYIREEIITSSVFMNFLQTMIMSLCMNNVDIIIIIIRGQIAISYFSFGGSGKVQMIVGRSVFVKHLIQIAHNHSQNSGFKLLNKIHQILKGQRTEFSWIQNHNYVFVHFFDQLDLHSYQIHLI